MLTVKGISALECLGRSAQALLNEAGVIESSVMEPSDWPSIAEISEHFHGIKRLGRDLNLLNFLIKFGDVESSVDECFLLFPC